MDLSHMSSCLYLIARWFVKKNLSSANNCFYLSVIKPGPAFHSICMRLVNLDATGEIWDNAYPGISNFSNFLSTWATMWVNYPRKLVDSVVEKHLQENKAIMDIGTLWAPLISTRHSPSFFVLSLTPQIWLLYHCTLLERYRSNLDHCGHLWSLSPNHSPKHFFS